MQNFPPEIKQLLTDWYLLTLENPLYAGALVISAWLLTVFFYSIRIYFLNKKKRATEQASIKVQGMLDESQQQNKKNEEELAAITEKMSQEQQLAAEFKEKFNERNQQIVENIKQLANKFDLSEQLVDSGDKPKAEFVWQQQDNIQMQLTDRLQAEREEKQALKEINKQEKEQFGKQEVLIGQLQKLLDLQTNQSSQLEQNLKTQRLLLQQQKNEAEQKLADLLAKHELDVAALVNDLNAQKETTVLDTEAKEVVETDVLDVIYQESTSEATTEVQANTLMPEFNVQEDKSVTEIEPELQAGPEISVVESVSEVLETAVIEEFDEQKIPKPTLLAEEQEIEPDYTKSNLDLSGKFKGLFGKNKKQTEKIEPKKQVEVLAAKVSPPELEKVVEELDYAKSNLNISGKFKNLFGKDKKQTEKIELEKQVEVLAAKVSTPELEEVVEELDYAKSNLNISGKFKNLFGKDKKQTEKIETKKQAEVLAEKVSVPEFEKVTEAEYQTEELNTAARESEHEEQVFEPDYTKSNLNISGKVKKLFGKS